VEEAGFERRSLGPLQRAEHAVDAVTRVPIDASHTPLMQRLDEEITHGGINGRSPYSVHLPGSRLFLYPLPEMPEKHPLPDIFARAPKRSSGHYRNMTAR